MATKTLAVVPEADEVEEAPAKPVKIPAQTLADDGETWLNTNGEPEPNTISKTAAAQEHKALVNAVKAAAAYEEQGDEVYTTFFEALESSYIDNIHMHYGFKTWTEYVNEHVSISIPNPEIRRRAVDAMSEWGASQRAIAKALMVSQATVSRDQETNASDSDESVEPKTTTGLDGRETKRRGKGAKAEPEDVVDAEVVELPKTGALPKRFASAVAALEAVADTFDELGEAKAFAANKKKLVAAHSEAIVSAANSILDLADKLGIYDQIGGEAEDEDEDAEDEDDADEIETDDEADEFEEEDEAEEDEEDEDDEEEDEDDEEF